MIVHEQTHCAGVKRKWYMQVVWVKLVNVRPQLNPSVTSILSTSLRHQAL
jgi:hypothetical protein